MNWLPTLAFAILLLSVQYDAVQSASTLSRSPWANPAKAGSLMNCLMSRIASSNVLPQQDKEDLESIMDTLMSAIKGASAKGKSSAAQLQAINMAVASSLAEIVVAEDAGNQASIAVKTQALTGALGQCFQAVMGTVDRKFINEINDLITMFAKEAASESNEIPDQESFSASGSSASTSYQAASQSFQGSSQTTGGISTYPQPQVSQSATFGIGSVGNTGGAGSYGGGLQSGSVTGGTSFGQTSTLSTSLSQTGGISTSGAGYNGPVGYRGPVGGGSQFGTDSSQTANLISRVANALSNTSTLRTVLRRGVSQQIASSILRRAAQTLASTLGVDGNNLSRVALQAISQVPTGSDTSAYAQAFSSALFNAGVLNASNIDTLGSRVLSAVLNGVSSAAQGLGINVDTGSVQSDISSSSSFLSTSSSASSFSSQASASSTSGAGYTGPSGYTGPVGGGAQFGSASGQSSFGQTSGLTASSGGQAAFGGTSGASAGLISRVANALANTSTLRAVLRRGVSQQTASSVVQRAAQSLASTLGIDGNNLSRVALQATSQVPTGSDTSAYAQAFSSALFNAGVLNASNIDTLGSRVLSAVLNGVSSAAQGLGINVDTGSVQSDISSSSSFLSTSSSASSFSSQASASSTSGAGYTGPSGYTGPVGGGAQFGSASGQSSFGQTSGFTASSGGQAAFGGTSGASAGLISRVANALANTSTLRAVLRRGVSQQTASSVVQRAAQSLASTLGVDGNNLSRVALQAISQVPTGSDTSAYAQAFSSALFNAGVLNASNIDTLGSRVLSAVLNGVSSAAQGLGINVDTGSVQSDISSSSSFLSTSSSASSFSSQASASSTSGAGYTGPSGYTGPVGGGAQFGSASGQSSFGQTSGFTASSGGQAAFGGTSGASAGLISRVANALANTSTLRAVLRRGVSQQTASSVVQRAAQSLASTLGVDGNNLSRVALQAISQVPTGSDTSAYAQAFSSALFNAGVLNASNIDTLGSRVLSAVLNGVSSAAQGLGINVDTGSVQSDISSSSSFLSTSSSASSFSSQASASSTSGAGYTGPSGYTGPVGGGAQFGSASGQSSFGQTSEFTASSGGQAAFGGTSGASAGLISRVANALANTSTLKAVLRRGVSQQTASSVVQRAAQSLASTLGVDGNNLSRVALQAISQVPTGSDTSAYAQAFSSALFNAGILNASNIDTLGSRVLSAVLNGVSSAAQGLGINVDTGSVQSDISSSSSFLSTSSSASSFSSQASASSTSGAGYTGPSGYTGPVGGGAQFGSASGQSSFGQTSGFTASSGGQAAFGGTSGASAGLISRVANALANTSTLRAVLRRGVSQQTASSVVQRAAQSLASTLGVDGNNLSRVALQAISQVPTGSDTSAYAQAFSSALFNAGVLNASNIDTLGSRVLSAVLNGVSSAAQGLGINVDTGSVQRDISSSSSFLSTSSSASSFSSQASASSTSGAGYTGPSGYTGPVGGGAQFGSASGQSSFGQTSGFTASSGGQAAFGGTSGASAGLISRVANALANTSTLKAVLRRGVSQQTASSVVQRAAQSLASTLGVDGNNLSRVALQAISQVPTGSDTSAYAQAFSSALFNAGVLNASNIDTLGSRVLSAVLNGVSSAAQGLGINVDTGSVQSDISSSSSFLSTSSSASSFSSQASASSTSGAGYTGPSGYTGPVGGGAQFGSASGQSSFGQTSGFTASSGGQAAFGGTSGASAGLISRVANALANTSTLRAVFRRGVSQQTASSVVQRAAQSLASTLGVDGNNLSRVALQAISQVPTGSDTSAYAQAFSSALFNAGVLNASNIDTLGSRVLSAVLNGVSSAAQGLGINVDTGSVQSDISSSSSFLSTSSSASSFSSQASASSTSGAGYTGPSGYTGPVGGGAQFGSASGQSSFGQTSGFTASSGGQAAFGGTSGASAGLISRVANALANTSTLRAVLRRGVSQQTASSVVQRAAQSLASTLGVDGNNLSRVALQAISQVPTGSDTSAYAQAFSSALFNAGVLNASNIDTLGSRVLSAVLNGVSSAAQGLGINVDTGSVQSDISSSSSFLSTSSSASSFSSQASASSTSGAGYTGPSGYTGPVGGGAQFGSASGQSSFGQTSGFTASSGGQAAFGGTSGASADLISRVANALANTSTLRAVLRRGVSQQTASSVVQRAAQSLASTLGVDGNNLSRVALQAISQVPTGSDTSAYAQAFSSALFNAGVLNASNIDTLGSRVLSAVLNGVSSAAQGLGINVNTGSVQSDISSSSSFLSTSSSASSFSSQASASSTSGAGYTGPSGYTGPVGGGAQFGSASGQSSFGQTSGFTASSGGQAAFGGTSGASAGLISRVANALANTSTLRAVLRRGVSQQTASSVVQRAAQSLASTLGVDGNNLSRVALQAISQVPTGSDTSAYAQAFSSALFNAGVLNASNIDTLGSRVLSAVLNGVSSAAQGLGINVDTGSVQSDISSSSSFLSTSSSASSFSSQASASSTSGAGYTGSSGYTGPKGGGAQFGSASGQSSFGQTSGFTASSGGQAAFGGTSGASAGLISGVANALANTSTLRAVFRRGVSQQTASSVVQRAAQSLASTLGVDGNNLSRVALQAISQVPTGSDTSAYAQAFSSALFNAGVLNASNIDTLGSRVLSAVLNGVSSAAQGLGINVDTGSVQSDISSSSSFLSTSSSASSFSTQASASSTSGAGYTGPSGYIGPVGGGAQFGSASGQSSFGQTSGFTASSGGQAAFGGTSGASAGLISRVANALANTSTLRAVLRRGVSQQTASSVVQRAAQSLASTLGVDGNNLSRVALQAISQVPTGSDTSAYAQAFSSALFNAGVLNASNIDTLGSRVLSAVLNGVSSAAQGLGINVDTGSVQSDISSSSSFLSTSSSASSFSSQASASSTSGAGYTGPSGYTGPVGGGAQFGSASGQSSFGQTSGFTASSGGQAAFGGTSGASAGLISRVANALANTSTLRAVLRRGVSQQTASSVVQRAAQSLASTLGVDGNNLSRVALQAISQVPTGSDTSAYAQAFSSALFNAGVLNASNIDTLGSRVLSAVLNGVSSAAQGLGINVDTGSVQSDISSSSSFLSTSSSASSFSSQASASSTSGAGYTGPSGYTGPVGGGAQFGSASGQSSFGQTSGFTASSDGQAAFGGTSGASAGLISRVANALANTSTLRAVLRRGVSQQTASSVVQRAAQSLASTLGVDGNNLSRVALQAISQVPTGSDTSAYAQAFSSALFNAGVLNASNIDTLGSRVLSAVLNGVSSAAQGLGINVDTGSVQSDISSSSSFLSTSSSASSFSSQASASSSGGAGYTEPSGYTGPVGGGAQFGSASGQSSFGQTSGFTASSDGQAAFGGTSGASAGLISRVANALANTSTLRAVLRRGVSQQTASSVVQRAAQSLASTLGVDGNNLSRVALQAISQVPTGSDTSAYAQAFSSALFNAGVLYASNIDTLGSRVLSAVLNGVSSAAQGLGINVDTGSVQSDISSSSSFLSTSSSASSFSSQASASSTSGAGYTGPSGYTGPKGGGAQFGSASGQSSFGQTSGFTASSSGQAAFGGTSGASAGLISRVANALANTSTLRAVLRRGVSQQTASSVVQRAAQSLASTLGVDGNNLSRVALQAISQVPTGSDTSAYAQAFSSALFNAGVLNASNIDTLGSRVLSAVLNGVSSAAQGLGINVDTGSVQSDISSSSSFLSTSSSASSFSSQASASSTSGAGYTGPSGYTGPVGGGAQFGSASGQSSFGQTSGFTASSDGQAAFGGTSGASAGLISRVANALANTSTLRAVLRRGVSQQTASSVVQRAAQSLASTLGVDGNNLSRVALQAISQVPTGSDTSAYAQAFSSALFNAGVLNASNIDTLGSRVLSAVLNGVSSAAQGLGINVDTGSVQSDISSSSSFLSTSSSASSFSSQASASSTSGAGYTEPSGYTGPVGGGAQFGSASGQSSFGQTSGFTASSDGQAAFGGTSGASAGLISRVANALANTSTLRAVLRRGVSQQTASSVVQRAAQSLASTLGVDGNNLSRVALQAISQVPTGSDTSAYAQAFSSALFNAGVLNASNIDTLGSRVLSAVLNGVSSAAQGLGINVDTGSVQSDISSSSSFLSTSSSASSFSSQASASSTSGAGYTGPSGYTGPVGGGAQFGSASGQSSFGQTSGFTASSGGQAAFGGTSGASAGLISRVANALANTSTLRAVLRRGVSQQTASSVVQRAAQSLASTLGVDGNNLSRVALQAISQVPTGSDTSAYAQAFSSALFNAGVLNASNIDTLGSRVLSAVLNGVSSAAQGLGINVDTGSVQSDISSSSSFLSTSSSASSISSQVSASSTSGAGYTGPSGYTGPVGGGAQFGSSSGQSSFGQTSGFTTSAGLLGATSGSLSGAGQSAGVSLTSSLNSPVGLRSGSAASRIRQLTSSVTNAVGPNGVDANALARSLQSSFSNLRSSGMSSSDAKIEVLLETIVSLLQLLSNTQIRGVNPATASSVANSAARSFELVLA
uniref:Aciniform spidroin 1 n=6 Tax=Argiope argentata TaxID=233271 RepID=W8FUS3_9ARAC|nr:aciniform spidroin 1 [Argiope argentata]